MAAPLLAIRPRRLGDVVLTTPALRALHRGHPQAGIHVVTDPPYAALIEGLPGVARVWGTPRTLREMIGLALQFRGLGFEWAIDFFGNPRSAQLALLSGARRRAGYDLRGRGGAYHVRVSRHPEPSARARAREYAADSHVRLAVAAGGIADGSRPAISLPAGALERVSAVLRQSGLRDPHRAIGLVAAGSWPTKTWPLAHAGLLARRLVAAGREVALILGPGEAHVGAALARLEPRVVRLPPFDVPELAAAIGELAAVVGTDSGPRHLAIAQDVPTFTWFGPTHPDNWTPDDARHAFWRSPLPCSACDRTQCPHWNCLPALTPGDAADRVLAHLERHERNPAALGTAARA